MSRVTGHFIGGAWTAAPDSIDVINPADGTLAGRVPADGPAEVAAAVAAAAGAFDGWAATPAEQRFAVVAAFRDGIAAERETLAQTLRAEMGAPITFARQAQVGVALADLDALLAAAREHRLAEDVSGSLVVTEPAGVVAAITPWNFPLHQIVLKLGAALLAGCTAVLKPSEVAPLNAALLAGIAHRAGVPAGVLNVVFGDGAGAGQALAGHPRVDLVSFTGSVAAGRRVGAIAGGAVKRLSLELGGKSAAIMLDDATIETAAPQVVRSCLANSGQTCAALTRLLVPRARLGDWLEAVTAALAPWTPGDPRLESTLLGPLASHTQRDRVREHIEAASAAGARLMAGGPRPPAGLEDGAYVRPTVFAGVTPSMRLFREEVFGPVLAVTGYDREDEAVALANDSVYGLSGGVWSADQARAVAVAERLRTGTVGINGAGLDVGAPFGGYKQSGVGRECGRYGLAEFLEVKSIMGAAGLATRS